MKRRLTGFGVVCLVIMSVITGCGSGMGKYTESAITNDSAAAVAAEAPMDAGGYGVYESVSDYYAEDAAEYEESGMTQGTELSEETAQTSERKLIRTVDLYTETEQYDDLLAALEVQIASLGGYVEYRYQYNGNIYDVYSYSKRSSTLTVRIPSDRLDEFINHVGETSNIVNKEERVEDVTLRYVDLESHRNALVTEQERLLELLEQAESVEDLITIESRLSQVRYELESMESQLRTLMNQVSYSTVYLSIQEVQRLSPTEEVTIWGRIRQGLANSFYDLGMGFQNGFVGFVINLPYIVLWLIVIVILFFVCRLLWRLFKKRYAVKAAKRTGQAVTSLKNKVKRNKRGTDNAQDIIEDKAAQDSVTDKDNELNTKDN